MGEPREQMIIRNLPLVSFVVGKMSDQSASAAMDREDAIAYGVEGLIQAVDAFDETRGTTFASFAVRRIRGSILDAIRRMDILPRSMRKNARELERATLEMASQLGRWATPREVADRLAITLSEVRSIMGYSSSKIVSLERVMADSAEEGSPAWDTSDPDEYGDPAAAVDRKASLRLLDQAICTLSPRDQKIIRMRYTRSMAFHEIGREMDLSESRVCQLHKRILGTLRTRLEREAAEQAA